MCIKLQYPIRKNFTKLTDELHLLLMGGRMVVMKPLQFLEYPELFS